VQDRLDVQVKQLMWQAEQSSTETSKKPFMQSHLKVEALSTLLKLELQRLQLSMFVHSLHV